MLTAKQQKFADNIIAGMGPSDAYRASYSAKNMSDKAVSVEASRLLKIPKIALEVEKARKETTARAIWSREMAIERLQKVNDLSFTELEENGTLNRATSRAFYDSVDRLNKLTCVDKEIEQDASSGGLPIIDTANLIPGVYADIWRDIMAHGHSEYIGESGRGSLKSTVLLSIAPIMLMLKDPKLCGVAFRRVGNTIRDSIYASLISAIRRLGVESLFEWSVQPMEIRRVDTGQVIMFRGLDDPGKAKSLTLQQPELYIGFALWEEFDQNDGERAVRVVEQTIKRGAAPHFWTLRAFNTPADPEHWAHLYTARQEESGDALVVRSTYLDVPHEWLGDEFIRDAERLKEVSPEAYENEYLGKAVGLTGRVFDNIRNADISWADIANFKWTRCGIDWGYQQDPFVFLRVAYDRKTSTIYIFDELYNTETLDAPNIEAVKHKLCDRDVDGQPIHADTKEGWRFIRDLPENEIRADAAAPKDIATWQHAGVNVMGASKRVPVADGIRWLAKRAEIVIDRRRCPLAYQEFSRYRAIEDAEGRFGGYPDKDNHTIDAVRYAVFDLIADPDTP